MNDPYILMLCNKAEVMFWFVLEIVNPVIIVFGFIGKNMIKLGFY